MEVKVCGRKEHSAEVVGHDITMEKDKQLPNRTLMPAPRRRAHQQLPVDELVATSIVGKRQYLLAGPGLRGRHTHTVRSAGLGWQESIPPKVREPAAGR
jgi:hypothetical protein